MRPSGRRILAILGAAGLLAVTCVGPGHADALPTLNISYWNHSAPAQETVIATQPSLLKLLKATPTWIPIDASPPAIAAMKAGSFDMITGVGNPPVVSGIANGGAYKVIWLGSIDYVQLVVRKSITSPQQMVGKTFVDLIGSSEDYAFRGWLKTQGLSNKVTVLGLAGMATPIAAFKSGRIDGAYADYATAAEMVKDGGHVLVDSVQIAKLGYAGINVTIVRDAFAKQHPEVVQGYVCAAVAATKLMEAPSRATRDAVFKASAALTGQSVDQAIATGEVGIDGADVKIADEWGYFYKKAGDLSSGGIAQNYAQTVAFLLANGKIHSPVSLAAITAHIDASYVKKALAGGCPR